MVDIKETLEVETEGIDSDGTDTDELFIDGEVEIDWVVVVSEGVVVNGWIHASTVKSLTTTVESGLTGIFTSIELPTVP